MNPTVSSHGYGDAKIYFLSGFPYKDDLNSGLALSGHSERELSKFLAPHNISLKMQYSGLFIREKLSYSGANVNKLKKAVSEVDSSSYEKLLLSEIKDIKPNVIVPMDDLSLGVVFPHIKKLTKPKNRKYWTECYRGSILPLRTDWQNEIPDNYIKVIPTFSPQYVYINPAVKYLIRLDFDRIAKYQNSIKPAPEYGLRWVCRSAQELEVFILRSLNNNPTFLTFDIETWRGMITCISFSFNGHEGVSIPLMPESKNHSHLLELAMLWRLVAKLLSHDIPKVNQNIKYDWIILERHGFYVHNVIGDTMLETSLIYPELPKGLDFLTSIYTDIAYYKDEGKEYNPRLHTRDRLYLYNAMDSIATHVVHTAQQTELSELPDVKNLYETEIVPLIHIYKTIDNNGILVDCERRQTLINKYEMLFDSNQTILRKLVGDDKFNARSPQQVGNLVYNILRYPKRTKTNEDGVQVYKTDKDTLDDLIINWAEANTQGKVGYSILSRIIMCRKLSKIIEYIKTPLFPGGYFKGTSNLAGTETGRSSFSKTIDEILNDTFTKFIRIGRSLQTISKHGFHFDEEIFDDFEDAVVAADMRSMFVPHKGFVFVEGDGNSAEARIVAVLAEDYELLASFDSKPKVHAKTAAMLFNVDVNTITKDFPTIPKIGMTYYDLGKRVRHGGHYDLKAFRLAQMTHIMLSECTRMLKLFHSNNPKIKGVFHHEVFEFLRTFRFLVNPFGRKRDFFGTLNDDMYKEALATLPQGTVSDLTKFTLRRVLDECPYSRFLTEQHDGVLAEIHESKWEKYGSVFKKHYERKFDFKLCSLPRGFELSIPCEISYSRENWASLKEIQV